MHVLIKSFSLNYSFFSQQFYLPSFRRVNSHLKLGSHRKKSLLTFLCMCWLERLNCDLSYHKRSNTILYQISGCHCLKGKVKWFSLVFLVTCDVLQVNAVSFSRKVNVAVCGPLLALHGYFERIVFVMQLLCIHINMQNAQCFIDCVASSCIFLRCVLSHHLQVYINTVFQGVDKLSIFPKCLLHLFVPPVTRRWLVGFGAVLWKLHQM